MSAPSRPLADFGFWNGWDTALEMFLVLDRFGILPYEGGWMNQPETVRADLVTLWTLEGEETGKTQSRRPNHPPIDVEQPPDELPQTRLTLRDLG